jgi:hypothetical protein
VVVHCAYWTSAETRDAVTCAKGHSVTAHAFASNAFTPFKFIVRLFAYSTPTVFAKSTNRVMLSSSTLDRLKPQRSEALVRIRTNGLGLLAVLITTSLLPLPGLWEAAILMWQSYNYRFAGRETVTLWWVLCFAGE